MPPNRSARPSPPSRREFVAASSLALLSASGCLFGAAHRGRAETASGQVANQTGKSVTVTVTLTTPDGTVDFERTYRLSPDDAPEFEVSDPAAEYALAVDVENGPSESVEWEVTPCSSWVHVPVTADAVDFNFSAC